MKIVTIHKQRIASLECRPGISGMSLEQEMMEKDDRQGEMERVR